MVKSLKYNYLRYKFWIADFMHGSKMWNHYKEIRYIYTHVDEGEKIRHKYLDNLLEFARVNTPFYQSIGKCSFMEYPIINKKIILDNYAEFLTPPNKIIGQVGPLHIQKTSGSTGTPFALPLDTNCRIRRIATIKYENELIGFHSFEPMVHLRSLSHYYNDKTDFLWNKQLNIIYIDNANLNSDKLFRIISLINDSRSKVVRGYMTTLDTITRFAIENKIVFRHRPVFISVGELLLEKLRQRVVNLLHCSIISQYGNEENGIFGQSLVNKSGSKIILNRANCFVEVLKFDQDKPVDAGELGRVVITDYTNYALPMIRYDIGDVATVGDVQNGIVLSLDKLSGRKTDMVYKTNGERIDLFNSISTEIYNNPSIKQWQFIQHSKTSYTLRISVLDNIICLQKNHFISLMQDLLGSDADISIEFVDEIPLLSSGKRKIVICEL